MIQYRVYASQEETTTDARNPRRIKHGVLVFNDESDAQSVAFNLRRGGIEVSVGLRIYVGRSYIDYDSAKLRHAREDFSHMLEMIDEAMTAPAKPRAVTAE